MSTIIDKTMTVVQQTSDFLKETGTNEIAKTAAKGFFSWLGDLFTKNSAKEKLKLVEENSTNQEAIVGLKANLEFILENNEDLQKQLEEKVTQIDLLLKQQIPQNINKNTTTIGDNSSNNTIIQGINSGNDTNITIGKQ
jgi:hypothetical protein